MKSTVMLFTLLILAAPLAALEIVSTDPVFTLRLGNEHALEVKWEDENSWFLETHRTRGSGNAGAIMRVYILKEIAEAGRNSTLQGAGTVTWKGFTLVTRRARARDQGGSHGPPATSWIVDKAVTVPLRGRAITIRVSAPESVEPQIDFTLETILAGLDGPSSWDVAAGTAVPGTSAASENKSDLLLLTLGPSLILLLIVLGVIYAVMNRVGKAAAPAPGQAWPPYPPPGTPPSQYGAQASQAAPVSAPAATAQAQAKSCRYCGAPLREGRKKCMGCGADAA